MFKDRLEKAIEEIQSKNNGIKSYLSLIEVCDPGQTGFKCRTINNSGDILLCPITVPFAEKIIIVNNEKPTLERFKGVHPHLAVVMESGSSQFKASDIVYYNPSMANAANQIIVKGALALVVSDSYLLGVDTNFNNLINV
jgi:hypothetical protein